jgi:hypothetical protein
MVIVFMALFSIVISEFISLKIGKKLFNNIINTGIYPELWIQSIIIPVFKKGDVNEPKNYRGISLVSHVGKLFTGLLNKRLLKWAEQHNVHNKIQIQNSKFMRFTIL